MTKAIERLIEDIFQAGYQARDAEEALAKHKQEG